MAAVEYRVRPISVEEYHRMAELGILREDERVELLRGQLVCKMTIGNRHRGADGISQHDRHRLDDKR